MEDEIVSVKAESVNRVNAMLDKHRAPSVDEIAPAMIAAYLTRGLGPALAIKDGYAMAEKVVAERERRMRDGL